MARRYPTADTDKKYCASVKRNTKSLAALWRTTYNNVKEPTEFIESAAESLAYQEALVLHYKSEIEFLEHRDRKRRSNETAVG